MVTGGADQVGKALGVMEEMKAEAVRLDEKSFAILLQGCAQ